MYKELAICIILVILIFSLDNFTQRYTKDSTNEMSDKLESLKCKIQQESDSEENTKIMDEIYSKWEEFHDISAIYIEHNELEKVEINMVACKDFIRQKIYDMAANEIEKTIFGLEHIQDKYAFSLINVF